MYVLSPVSTTKLMPSFSFSFFLSLSLSFSLSLSLSLYIYIYNIYIGEDGKGAGHARVSHGERLPKAPAREDNPVAGVANVLLTCC